MTKAGAIARAAQDLLLHLERGQSIDAPILRTAMDERFWRLRRRRRMGLEDRPTTPAKRRRSCSFASSARPCAHAPLRRPRCCRCWQRSPAFFPPIPAAPKRARRFSSSVHPFRLVLRRAPPPRSRRLTCVLEPSAGTGLLAILAEVVRRVSRSQRARRDPRGTSFTPLSRHRRHALRRRAYRRSSRHRTMPSVVLMNPPFSAVANVDRRMADAAWRHIASALARLPEGGRLVAITGASCSPDNPAWRDAFVRLAGTRARRLHRRHRWRGLSRSTAPPSRRG